MRLTVHEFSHKTPVLFVVSDEKKATADIFKKVLSSYDLDIFTSPHLPQKLDRFHYVFVIADLETISQSLQSVPAKHRLFIILHNQKEVLPKIQQSIKNHKNHHSKAVNIDDNVFDEKTAEKILWFFFTDSPEKTLDLQRTIKLKDKSLNLPKLRFSFRLKKRQLLAILFFSIVVFQLLFLAPLLVSTIFMRKSAQAIKTFNLTEAKRYEQLAKPLVKNSRQLYTLARPIYSFFYIALVPDDLMLTYESAYDILHTAIIFFENGQKLTPLLFTKEKTAAQKKEAASRVKLVPLYINQMLSEINVIAPKVSSYKIKPLMSLYASLSEMKKNLEQAEKISKHLPTLLGRDKKMTYLLLFENNMELRPGGGFIGSFALATFEDFTLSDMTVYDVYDADGQLKTHIEPPEAIKRYLNQPHWFLRDSNFSPDFEKNVRNAEFFLERELKTTNLDGAAAMTTTAISYLIEALGEVYLPDYNEVITKDNFYIKTQLAVESNFFPGSKQKKNFLSALVQSVFARLQTNPSPETFSSIKKGLDEKHIVINMKNQSIQDDIELLGFSGKVILPRCPNSSKEAVKLDCVIDALLTVDANLGVNKANFYIARLIAVDVEIKDNGDIQHTVTQTFKNSSPTDIFPGGPYKNYLQLFIPKEAIVSKVTFKEKDIEHSEFEEADLKTVAFYIEIPPQQSADVKVFYTLPQKITAKKTLYQLVIQKQIGAQNSDLVFQLHLPPTVSIVNQNFSALAKSDGLVYNTNLSNDRIFLLEFDKH